MGASIESESELKTQAGTRDAKSLSPSSSSSSSSSASTSFLDTDDILDSGSNRGGATQSPPTQVMERADHEEGDPNRIPAHVFDRTKSSAPVEWSVCSNESLFSIHMGNMSFTRDQANWMGKSGELGYPGELDHQIDFSSNQPPSSQVSELNSKNQEAAAAETMREVIREASEPPPPPTPPKASEVTSPPPPPPPRPTTPPSRNSDDSIKSFAFPM